MAKTTTTGTLKQSPFQVYTSVKIIDDTLERHGQVGTVIDIMEPVTVKFDDGEETFANEALLVL
jgi:hypothetical protein